MPATPITLAVGATSIALPADLEWTDEHAWQPVAQSIDYSVTGAMILETAQRLAGRTITLAGAQDRSTLLRAVLEQCHTWAQIAGQVMTLTLRGVDYSVLWAHPDAINASQLVAGAPIDSEGGGRYAITLKFIEI